MATEVDQARLEIDAALAVNSPQLEGLRDFSRLNLTEQSQEEVSRSIEEFARRNTLLLAAKEALAQLVHDGYPEVPVRELVDAVFVELRSNKDSIEAAFAKFSSNQARSLNLTVTDT
jgi:hypothetical protein